MGGDHVPSPLDPLVKEFEAWKATLPKVKINRAEFLLKKYRVREMEEMLAVAGR